MGNIRPFWHTKVDQSDNSTEFVKQFAADLVTWNGSSHRNISAHNLRTNGAAERTNRIESILMKECAGALHRLDEFVFYVQLAYTWRFNQFNAIFTPYLETPPTI